MYQIYFSGMDGGECRRLQLHVRHQRCRAEPADSGCPGNFWTRAIVRPLYKSCLDIIVDWAVEVPVYQRQNAIIFSTERVNMNTVTPDITTFYGWLSEVEKIELN